MNNNRFSWMGDKVRNTKYLYSVVFLLGLGVFLRLMHLLGNRSLWMDEAKLALNFVQSPTWDIFQPLLHNQVAPLGFLLIQKFFVDWFGGTETVLRLYPFLAGILSVFLIYRLASKVFGPWVGVTALGIFVVSHKAIYYAAEVKQYSSDITIALVLFLAAAYALKKWNASRWLILTATGVLGVLLSHPATFILAGIGISMGLQCIARKQWADVFRLGASALIWIAGFAFGLYATSVIGTGPSTAGADTLSYMSGSAWTNTFAPFPPASTADIRWYWTAFFNLFKQPLGFAAYGLAAFLFLAGIVHLWSRNRLWLGILVLPMLIVLTASALHLYPFYSRLLMFLAPGTIIVMAAGLGALREYLGEQGRFIWILALAVLLFQPVWGALKSVTHEAPYSYEDIRTVLEHIEKQYEAGDTIYVYAGAASGFRYYQTRFSFPEDRIIWGSSARRSWDNYLADIDRIKDAGRTSWLVFSHVGVTAADMDEERFLLHFLDKVGERQDTVQAKKASGYLYRFPAGQ